MKSHQILLVVVSVLLLQSLSYVSSANILGMFLTHAPSHVIVHMGVVRALVERGHNVTVMTSMKLNDPNFGYRHIYLKTLEHTQQDTFQMMDKVLSAPFYLKPARFYEVGVEMFRKYTSYQSDPDYIKFKKENNHFDLFLLGYQYNEVNLGEAADFKCPTVLSYNNAANGPYCQVGGKSNSACFCAVFSIYSTRSNGLPHQGVELFVFYF